jgi:5-methyltetrahydropteroyltriglutamate--homocysteine methyltransferase
VPRHGNEYYKSDEEFLFALAARAARGIQGDRGCRPVRAGRRRVPALHVRRRLRGKDLAAYRKWAAVRIDALNHALEGLPEEKVRYHICWGSFNTPHVSDVALQDIVDLVLKVKAGAYCIEMGNPRHEHEWRVWETAKLPRAASSCPV